VGWGETRTRNPGLKIRPKKKTEEKMSTIFTEEGAQTLRSPSDKRTQCTRPFDRVHQASFLHSGHMIRNEAMVVIFMLFRENQAVSFSFIELDG
jgi:hypothetical protein